MSGCYILPLPRLYDFLPPPDPEKDEAAKAVCGTYFIQNSLNMFEPFQSVSKVIFTLLSQILHIFIFDGNVWIAPLFPRPSGNYGGGSFLVDVSTNLLSKCLLKDMPPITLSLIKSHLRSFRIIPQLDQLEPAKSSPLACQAAAVGTSWNLGIGVVTEPQLGKWP